jgi:hypothetical protein
MSAHRSVTSLTDDEVFPLKTMNYRGFSLADYSELVDLATAVCSLLQRLAPTQAV